MGNEPRPIQLTPFPPQLCTRMSSDRTGDGCLRGSKSQSDCYAGLLCPLPSSALTTEESQGPERPVRGAPTGTTQPTLPPNRLLRMSSQGRPPIARCAAVRSMARLSGSCRALGTWKAPSDVCISRPTATFGVSIQMSNRAGGLGGRRGQSRHSVHYLLSSDSAIQMRWCYGLRR